MRFYKIIKIFIKKKKLIACLKQIICIWFIISINSLNNKKLLICIIIIKKMDNKYSNNYIIISKNKLRFNYKNFIKNIR